MQVRLSLIFHGYVQCRPFYNDDGKHAQAGYTAKKIDGEWVQRLRIHYNCVGEMNIPNEPALPIPTVTVNTGKGVFVSYTTDDSPAV